MKKIQIKIETPKRKGSNTLFFFIHKRLKINQGCYNTTFRPLNFMQMYFFRFRWVFLNCSQILIIYELLLFKWNVFVIVQVYINPCLFKSVIITHFQGLNWVKFFHHLFSTFWVGLNMPGLVIYMVCDISIILAILLWIFSNEIFLKDQIYSPWFLKQHSVSRKAPGCVYGLITS